jgi:hypothetical protein
MFVAALSHTENAAATSRGPDRRPISAVSHPEIDRGVPLQHRMQSPRAVAARHMLSPVIASGF